MYHKGVVMKKIKGFSIAGLVAVIAVITGIVIAGYFVIDGNNKATNYNSYDFFTVIEPSKDNGWIGDHVKGDKDAPVLVFEYADYQCPGCAEKNPKVNKLVDELKGKLGVVYRNFILSYHQNGTAAASAAEAAGLQGYWRQYADKLFAEQAEWQSASPSERTAYFNKYFEEVTGGKGDMEKFNTDLASENVSKKINFDMGVAKRVDVESTPAFYVDGQLIEWSNPEGGSITINGKEITWDSGMKDDEFIDLLRKIVKAKTGE